MSLIAFSADLPNLKFLFISIIFLSHISILLHRHPMPKRLVRSMESPCISCRKIAYKTIYNSDWKLRKPSLVLLYNQWIRQELSQT